MKKIFLIILAVLVLIAAGAGMYLRKKNETQNENFKEALTNARIIKNSLINYVNSKGFPGFFPLTGITILENGVSGAEWQAETESFVSEATSYKIACYPGVCAAEITPLDNSYSAVFKIKANASGIFSSCENAKGKNNILACEQFNDQEKWLTESEDQVKKEVNDLLEKMKIIRSAQAKYYRANKTFARDISKLGINLPKEYTAHCYSIKGMCDVTHTGNTDYSIDSLFETNRQLVTRCKAFNEKGNQVCKLMGWEKSSAQGYTSRGKINFYTVK